QQEEALVGDAGSVDDSDDDDEVLESSIDKELVINSVNEISGLYFEYTTYKRKDFVKSMYLRVL
ncbi:MAG: hypothetical protein CL877_00500, partial [Dehalococcoidales bacterium]|nr:hypothetical protein [Dehalococcoidales bacterium]